jgi:hypothetical protein
VRLIVLSFVLLGALACSDKKPAEASEKPAPVAAEKAAPAEPAGPDQEAYVKAAVRIACAGKTITDAAKLAEEVAAAQKDAGFDAQSWTAMAQQVAKDGAATRRISDGAASCK